MTYYIFGDSYGDPGGAEDGELAWAWHQRLQKHDRVKNFCKGASGPIDHFKQFWKMQEEICKDQNSKIVFLLSNPFRLRFDFLEYGYAHAKELGDYMVLEKIPENIEQPLDYIELHDKEIKQFYKLMGDELFHLNYKNVMTLKCLSVLFKIKIMVFVCFTLNNGLFGSRRRPKGKEIVSKRPDTVEDFKDDNFFKLLENLNDQYFKFYSTPLMKYGRDYGEVPVKVYNHLSEYDHGIMYNIITNHFHGFRQTEDFSSPMADLGTKNYIYD